MAETVEVAVRIRPLVKTEISQGSQNVLDVYAPYNQIKISHTDKAFTYNYVFNGDATQNDVYEYCVRQKVPELFKGYNVTVIAYGQTGSGKTHTMGTAYSGEDDPGIIPRVLTQIFDLCRDNFSYQVNVSVSFLELYQEVAYDLLTDKSREQAVVEVREDAKGIVIPKLTEVQVGCAADALVLLRKGSSGRATAATNMNAQSSRSHAIYTVNLSLEHKQQSCSNKTAKFHLVDLAGSERQKKTGTTGQTFREGVNINKGLLVLGNVIAALSDGTNSHVPYRDSNLTRLLKDSLGGNSITLMIACVSPADYNVDETVSTLRYADRARRIKNKPIINEDPRAAEINRLQRTIKELKLQLLTNGTPGTSVHTQPDNEAATRQLEEYKQKCKNMMMQLSVVLNEKAFLLERHMNIQKVNEKFRELKELFVVTLRAINNDLEQDQGQLLKKYVLKLEAIKEKFVEVDMGIRDNENEFHEVNLSNSNTSMDVETEKEISERHEFHTAQQVALNSELQKIAEELGMKERLAREIATGNNYAIDYTALAEHESKIAQLEKEKLELLQQLQSNPPSEPNCKISEQRSRKIKELEDKINDLKKKVQAQERLIKLKEKDEEKIRKLNTEIVSLKQTKVKLVRNMRQESDKFRVWKNQREREVTKLKEQNRKKESQIVKMESVHSRQQNVLKRKMEEVNAVNKRLKDALALRKAAQDNKSTGKMLKLEQWLKQELDVYIHLMEAQATLPILLEYRGNLQSQLDSLKQTSPDNPSILQLEEEIELRSIQIQDMQQKILDSDEDSKDRMRWERIQSIVEAKSALKYMVEVIGDGIKRESALKHQDIVYQAQIGELQSALLEVNAKVETSERLATIRQTELDECRKRVEQLVQEKQQLVANIENSSRETSVGCSRMGAANNASERDADESTPENERVDEGNGTFVLQNSPTIVDVTPGANKKLRPFGRRQVNSMLPSALDVSTDVETDDPEADPDWRKTPLAKRILKMRADTVELQQTRTSVKRSSDGGCMCRKNCSSKVCGCRKVSRQCSAACKCSDVVCTNRTENNENLPEEPTSTTSEDALAAREEDSFLLPKIVPKRRRFP